MTLQIKKREKKRYIYKHVDTLEKFSIFTRIIFEHMFYKKT